MNNVFNKQAIPNFLATDESINGMNCPRIVAVLLELGITVGGTANLPDKKKVLKTAIGISEIKRD